MSYINQKYSIINDLVKEIKAKENEVTIATANDNAANLSLVTQTTILQNDLSSLTNVKTNLSNAASTNSKILNLQKDIIKSCKSSEALHQKMEELVQDTMHSARKTIECAVQFSELSKHVASAEKGKADKAVLMALISNEVATSPTVAEKAVSTANAAVKDTIAAAGAVVHLHQSLLKTQELIEKVLPLISNKNEKKQGVTEILEVLLKEAHTQYENSEHSLKAAQKEYNEAQKKLTDKQNELNVVSQGLKAAEAAIALAN